jgi:hypothetical protein
MNNNSNEPEMGLGRDQFVSMIDQIREGLVTNWAGFEALAVDRDMRMKRTGKSRECHGYGGTDAEEWEKTWDAKQTVQGRRAVLQGRMKKQPIS